MDIVFLDAVSRMREDGPIESVELLVLEIRKQVSACHMEVRRAVGGTVYVSNAQKVWENESEISVDCSMRRTSNEGVGSVGQRGACVRAKETRCRLGAT
jgi:hypothetical protein